MKKILLLALMTPALLSASNDSLWDAIKNGDVETVKELIADKAHAINATEIKKKVHDLSAKFSQHYAPVPWYQRYGSLAKVGLGTAGLILAGRVISNASSINPENANTWGEFGSSFLNGKASIHNPAAVGTSRSTDTMLCVSSGAAAVASIWALWQGCKELRKHVYHSKLMTIKSLIEETYKNK